MRATMDLAALFGAEFTTKDGVPGVFIPLVPNCTYRTGPQGKHAYVTFRLFNNKSSKSFDMRGVQSIPKEHADRYLENPKYAGKRSGSLWLWNGDERPGGAVSREEFEKIIGG